jgi:hypothetical protein
VGASVTEATGDDHLRRRLAELVEQFRQAGGPTSSDAGRAATAQRHAYGRFDDALAAAGLAARLGESPEAIRGWLERAAESGIDVYRWLGSTVSEITYLPSEESETFIDGTMTTAWTFVRAAYAALAAGRQDLLDNLMRQAPEPKPVERSEVAESLLLVAGGLWHLLSGDRRRAREALQAAAAQGDGLSAGERLWVLQARALLHLLDQDEAAFAASLGTLSAAWKDWYATDDRQSSPEGFLVLPVHGLRALSQRK